MTEIHHTISLGGNCHTSMFLKQCGLKRFSCPFDWIGLSLDDILEILETRFTKFLDPSYFMDHVEGDPGKCGHRRYGDRFFNHFNPRIPDHHAYYQRCIDRFCAVNSQNCSPDINVLYVYQAFYNDPPIEQLRGLRDMLREQYRGNDGFVLLALIHKTNGADGDAPTFSVTKEEPNMIVAHTRLVGNINGVAFLDPRDAQGMAQFLDQHFKFNIIPITDAE
jgi:Putative papain-like cysteine peptidase (DUF1796)